MIRQKVVELSEREKMFKDMFPNIWICPFCMAEESTATRVPRDEILRHVIREHPDNNKLGLTWEQFYGRMSQVGGV